MRRAGVAAASWIACGVLVAVTPAARAADPRADERPGALGAVAVPGGVDALAAAAGLPVPAPRATLALEVIRRLHGGAAGDPAAASRRDAVAAALQQPLSADTIPLPFDEGLWSRVVFGRKVPPTAVLPGS